MKKRNQWYALWPNLLKHLCVEKKMGTQNFQYFRSSDVDARGERIAEDCDFFKGTETANSDTQ